jgi:hypothetical protein
MIYSDGTRLPGSDAADPDTVVLISDIVGFTSEHRLLILDGQVHAGSQYAEDGHAGPVLRRNWLAVMTSSVGDALSRRIHRELRLLGRCGRTSGAVGSR